MRSFLFIALVLAACSKGSSTETAPAPKSTETAPAPPSASPTPAAPTPAAAPAPAAPTACTDTKSVTLKQWNYGDKKPSTITFACQDGVRKVALLEEDMEPITYTLPGEVWETLWTQLDAASWRDVTTKCPKTGAISSIYSNENQSVEKLEVQVTDGEANATFACKTSHLASQHVAITDAMVQAMLAAVKSSST